MTPLTTPLNIIGIVKAAQLSCLVMVSHNHPVNFANEIHKMLDNFVISNLFCLILSDQMEYLIIYCLWNKNYELWSDNAIILMHFNYGKHFWYNSIAVEIAAQTLWQQYYASTITNLLLAMRVFLIVVMVKCDEHEI